MSLKSGPHGRHTVHFSADYLGRIIGKGGSGLASLKDAAAGGCRSVEVAPRGCLAVVGSLAASHATGSAEVQVNTFLYGVSKNKLLLLRETKSSAGTHGTAAGVVSLDDNMVVHAIKEYNDASFTILVGDADDASAPFVLAQFDVELVADELTAVPDGECAWTVLESAAATDGHAHIKAWRGVASGSCAIAVSGSRQVACVVSSNRKNVQLLDLAIEEEEEEEDDDDDDDGASTSFESLPLPLPLSLSRSLPPSLSPSLPLSLPLAFCLCLFCFHLCLFDFLRALFAMASFVAGAWHMRALASCTNGILFAAGVGLPAACVDEDEDDEDEEG